MKPATGLRSEAVWLESTTVFWGGEGGADDGKEEQGWLIYATSHQEVPAYKSIGQSIYASTEE